MEKDLKFYELKEAFEYTLFMNMFSLPLQNKGKESDAKLVWVFH